MWYYSDMNEEQTKTIFILFERGGSYDVAWQSIIGASHDKEYLSSIADEHLAKQKRKRLYDRSYMEVEEISILK